MSESPSTPILKLLRRLDESSPNFHDLLSNVLYGEEYQGCVSNLHAADVKWLVEYLDRALGFLDSSSLGFRKCLRELRSVCGASGILPTSYTIPTHLLKIAHEPFARGGYGDVYEGTLNSGKVCIKRVRVYTRDGPGKAAKTFCREAVVWKRLTHPNILPLLGVTIAHLQLISHWMPGGDLPGYIREHPDADRVGLLSDIAEGLCHLHLCNIIHGDLKGPNVLVDNSGRAIITDFGLATVTQNLDSIPSASHQGGHTPRWAPPEVLGGGVCSKEADIFSYAMVVIEIFTGAIPFSDKPHYAALMAVMNGERPPQPAHPAFAEDLWTLVQHCWEQDPHSRPEIADVLKVLQSLSVSPGFLQRLCHLDRSSPGFHDQLNDVLYEKEYRVCVSNLDADDMVWLVEYLDKALNILDPSTSGFRKCLRELRRICGARGILPASYTISSHLLDVSLDLFARRNFGDVSKAILNGTKVSVNRIRIYTRGRSENLKATKSFCKEAVLWKTLKHRNIVPLLGVTFTPLQFISEWAPGGTLREYIKKNPETNRLGLLSDIAEGLNYIHSRNVIHGCLMGPNILVDVSGNARMTNFFGGPTTTPNQEFMSGFSQSYNPPQWTATEILHGGEPSKKADIFSFAVVMVEVFTGAVPFSDLTSAMVLLATLQGDRPPRPTHITFTEDLWTLMQRCWDKDPHLRPGASEISQDFRTRNTPK